MMGWLLRTLVASAAVALAALLADGVARRAGWPRRAVWGAALALAGLMPALAVLLPATSPTPALPLPPGALAGLLAGAPAGAESTRSFLDASLVAVVWAVVSGALLVLLAYAAWRLRRVCAGWPTLRLDGGDVVVSTGAGPLVVGVVRPRVVVPPWVVAAPESERRMVLAHEREHLRAGDARLLAAAALVPALAPWNLPLWWLVRRLREAVETDCDRRVLAGGFAPVAYGRLLLSTAAGPRLGLVPGVALAEPKRLLERRLIAMTGGADRRVRRLLPLALGAAVLLVVACEVARPDASAPTSPVAPRADAAVAGRTPAASYQAGYEEGRLTALAMRLLTDTAVMRRRQEAGKGGITKVTARRLSPSEAEITTVDAQGRSEVHRVRMMTTPAGGSAAAERARVLFEAGRAMVRARGDTVSRASGPGAAAAGSGAKVLPVPASGGAPLVFIDGVPATDRQLHALAPGRIRSINVLKGEAALREYGERGANGVIRVVMK